MRFIKAALEKLSLIDLTNKNEVERFKRYLIEQRRHITDWHVTNHTTEFCDCRETERMLQLFSCMIMYLDILLQNNNF